MTKIEDVVCIELIHQVGKWENRYMSQIRSRQWGNIQG